MSAAPAEARSDPGPAAAARRHALLPVACLMTSLALTYPAAPVLTLVNDGLVVTPRLGAWLSALAPALLWVEVARRPRAPWHRALGIVLALVLAGLGLDRALDRLRVDNQGLSQRGLFGTRALAWAEITRVDAGTARLIAWAGDERQVSVSLDRWKPEQRATLERSVARRVREAAAPDPAGSPSSTPR